MLADSIRNQTRQIFQNIEILLKTVPSDEFDTVKGAIKAHFLSYWILTLFIKIEKGETPEYIGFYKNK